MLRVLPLLLILAATSAAGASDPFVCAVGDAKAAGSDLSTFATVTVGDYCVDISKAQAGAASMPIPANMNACNLTISDNAVQMAKCASECSPGPYNPTSMPFLLCSNDTDVVCSCGFGEDAFANTSYCNDSTPGYQFSTQLTPACLYQNESICANNDNKACLWVGSCCEVNRGQGNVEPWFPFAMSQALMWIIVIVFILLMIQSVVMCFMHRRRLRGYISGIRTRPQAKELLDTFMRSLDDYHPTPQPGTQPVTIGAVNAEGTSSNGEVLSGTALLGGTPGDECAICLNDMASKRAVQLLCMHCFHRECIEDLLQHELVLKNEVLCPLCRTVFMQVPSDQLVTGEAA